MTSKLRIIPALRSTLKHRQIIFLVLTSLLFFATTIEAQTSAFHQSLDSIRQIRLFTGPDESSQQIEVSKFDGPLVPVAETIGSEGVKWYLVKTKNGATGWIKGGESDEAARIEAFFRSSTAGSSLTLPVETLSTSLAQPYSGAILVPIHMTGSAAFVSVLLNHAIQAYMLLDTGATYTVVSRKLAASLSLSEASRTTLSTANGLITVPLAHLQSIQVGAAEALNLTVAIQDASMNPTVAGLLGLDFLSRFHTSIDSRKQLLILAPR
ncbi:MAG: retroviral-like aspartic protease family protein [Alphaproteobacteria bacterium]